MAATLLPVILRSVVEFAGADGVRATYTRDAIVSLCTFGARGRRALRQAVDRPGKNWKLILFRASRSIASIS